MITKNELVEAVKSVFDYVNEWQSRDNTVFPRAIYFNYVRSSIKSSGTSYEKNQTIQVSIFSKHPNEPKVNELEDVLINMGIMPEIYIEYNESDRVFHYFFSITCQR